jgi:uncharacterized membrane protein
MLITGIKRIVHGLEEYSKGWQWAISSRLFWAVVSLFFVFLSLLPFSAVSAISAVKWNVNRCQS